MGHLTENAVMQEQEVIDIIQQNSFTLPNKAALQPLFNKIGNARIVMLGESTHGSHEYYTWRSYITQRLIEEKGFACLALEADWPDAYKINRFVKDPGDHLKNSAGYKGTHVSNAQTSAAAAGNNAYNENSLGDQAYIGNIDQRVQNSAELLRKFTRWPAWLWSNWEMASFTSWLKEFNRTKSFPKKVGVYGLDVYSLWQSMETIMDHLRDTDPAAMQVAEEAFQCFEPFRRDGRVYGKSTRLVAEHCEQVVKKLLQTIRQKDLKDESDPEHAFNLEQNARVAVNAEEYYRIMLEGGPHSWNLRDKHMADTLEKLLDHHGPGSRIVVWAHNTHIGDARATDMVDDGMFNLGEIARIRHQQEGVVLVGFGSNRGSLIASRSWGGEMFQTILPPARKNSWEHYLHLAGAENRLLITEHLLHNDLMMETHFDHRAVGVVYDPVYDGYKNYVPTIIPLRYDAFIYIENTKGLHTFFDYPDGGF